MIALEAANVMLLEIFYLERQNGEVVNLNYFEEVIPRYNDNLFHSHFRMHRRTYIVNIDLYLIIIINDIQCLNSFIINYFFRNWKI